MNKRVVLYLLNHCWCHKQAEHVT